MTIRRMTLSWLAFCCFWTTASGETDQTANESVELTIASIMRDPKWIGSSPRRVFWSEDGRSVHFSWNPENADSDSLYIIPLEGDQPRKLTPEERHLLPSQDGDYDRSRSGKVYEKDGDLFLLDVKSGTSRQITNTVRPESDPQFTHDGKKITFLDDKNLFLWHIGTGEIGQVTDFREGREPSEKEEPRTDQEKWLKQDQLNTSQIIRERREERERRDQARKENEPPRPRKIFVGSKRTRNIQLSPDERFVTFLLADEPDDIRRTVVPDYVTESGFTEELKARPKVGHAETSYEFGIYDRDRDTVYYASTDSIPGIYDIPQYMSDYLPSKELEDSGNPAAEDTLPDSDSNTDKLEARKVVIRGPFWSDDGRLATVVVLSLDHKDRWIMLLDPATGELSLLDRQHDEAWIGGPGISAWWGGDNIGWLPDNRRLWFQSEKTGFSHLYTVDAVTADKQQLTDGDFEVRDVHLARDGKRWYFTSNQKHPGEQHFYQMPVAGGTPVQITQMNGRNRTYLSPDERNLAILHSYSNRPWELFLVKNEPGPTPKQVTFSVSDEFKAYPWRDPQIVTFTARDSATVHARLFQPDNPTLNGPAVIFVHGAGYLQNAHRWWSMYFREYMFHNFLVDHGYTVMDLDYRGSAGYGRDWRTAIYRHMGGKDLTDQVDGAHFLVENCNVDSSRIGIYGGSYGGFITIMAMCTQPGIFAAGAALRSVTDWAHYGDGYTSNILNTPFSDSLAYKRSSPIYFAEGLEGALLICHGMRDRNVHFQDVVRLVQRFIELGKENWELAVYPLEGHGFVEPSSWTDEYRRIFELFENNLK